MPELCFPETWIAGLLAFAFGAEAGRVFRLPHWLNGVLIAVAVVWLLLTLAG